MFSNNNYPMNNNYDNNFNNNNNNDYYDNFNNSNDYYDMPLPQPGQPSPEQGQPNLNLESVQVTEQGGYFIGPTQMGPSMGTPPFGQPGFGMGQLPPFAPPVGQPGFGMGQMPYPPVGQPGRPPMFQPPFLPPTNVGFGLNKCLNTVTLLTLSGNTNIWFFPTAMNNFTLFGFRWGPRGWVRDTIPLPSIRGFTCLREQK